jgi:hypothetical protein
MIKSRGPNGKASVTFNLTADVGAGQTAICGEWNDWRPDRDVMDSTAAGFTRTVELEAGRTYRFRYLLDGYRWENDWAADAYVPNEYGGDDSVVDLRTLDSDAPAVTVAAGAVAPPKKSAPRTAPAVKKAGPVKTAGSTKKAGPNKAR